MNRLLILLVLYALGGNKLANLKELLQKIDFQSFSPVLKLVGLNDNVIDFLSSKDFENALNGEVDLKSLLPLFISGLSQNAQNKSAQPSKNKDGNAPLENNYLKPIKSVAPTFIEDALGDYFS